MQALVETGSSLLPGIIVGAGLYAVLPWLPRRSTAGRIVPIAITLILAWRYMAWRILESLPPVGLTADFIVGVIFCLAEALTLLGTSLTFVFLSRWRSRSADADANGPWLDAQGPFPPLVDVLICTYNEEREILERTIDGALAMDYANCRIWVLDDGRRPWLEALCDEAGVRYLTRPDNRHAKAGNINHALHHIERIEEHPDFIAIFDADFVPKANFLQRTVSLMRDEGVGIVQTPQHFINPDPIQSNLFAANVWPDEQRFFFDVLMPSKDAWDAAFCCGTSSLIRFEALRGIGGFATESVTEDFLVTLALQEAGYRTIYLNEKLSLGLAPEGVREYVTQRSRWSLGLVQICRSAYGPLRRNRLRLIDRVSLVESFLYWSACYAFRLLCILVPILYWVYGVHAVDAEVSVALAYFLPSYICQVAVTVWLAEGRILPILADVSQILTAFEILKSVVIGLTRPRGHKFNVTAKGGVRDRRLVQWPVLRRFLVLLGFTIFGIVMNFWMDGDQALDRAGELALIWGWYNICVLVVACMVCIEQPRFRRDERISVAEPATLVVHGRCYHRLIVDLSAGGLRVAGDLPAECGASVIVNLGDLSVPAILTRVGHKDFGLAFDDAPAARDAIMRYVYAGVDRTRALDIRSTEVAAAVVSRVFR